MIVRFRAFFPLPLLVVSLAGLSLPVQSQDATDASSPRQSLRLPDMPLHDPWILAYAPSRTYYLYTSNNRRVTGVNYAGTMAYKSKDLLSWEQPVVVFTVPDGVWANPQ